MWKRFNEKMKEKLGTAYYPVRTVCLAVLTVGLFYGLFLLVGMLAQLASK